jgi:sorting nexin-13
VDDAMDDIVRQFKGVSDGLKRAVGTSPSSATAQFEDNRMSLSWNQEEKDNHNLHQRSLESAHSLSDGDSNNEDHTSSVNSGCHSDNEVNNRGHTLNDVKHIETHSSLDKQASDQIGKPTRAYSDSSNMLSLNTFEDATGIPPEVHHTLLLRNLFDADHREWLFLLFFY